MFVSLETGFQSFARESIVFRLLTVVVVHWRREISRKRADVSIPTSTGLGERA